MGRPHQTRGDLLALPAPRQQHKPLLLFIVTPMRSSARATANQEQWVRPLQHKIRGETTAKRETPHSKLAQAFAGGKSRTSALPPRGSKVSRSRETTAVAAAPPAEATMVPPIGTTYHEGELSVQERMGVAETAKFRSAHQKTFLPEPSQDFFAKRPFVVISALDAEGRMYCSMVATADGSPCLQDVTSKSLVLRAGSLSPRDALRTALVPGTAVGLIGIDFSTRARVRVNSTVSNVAANGDVTLAVEISASHCAQYITQRTWQASPGDKASSEPKGARKAKAISLSTGSASSQAPGPVASLQDDPVLKHLIDGADTFFIGSSYGRRDDDVDARHGADASNRCGSPGFVRVTGHDTLTFDNYNGNQMYSTLGNITKDPRVGLTFFDWESGEALQISGIAAINFAPEQQQGGGERVLQVVTVRVDSVRRVPGALPGTWKQSQSRPLVISKKVDESEGVTSFYLKAPALDPRPLAPFISGQHMPVLIKGLNRSYSLSGNPGDDTYRISVKNIGQVSSALHKLQEGDEVTCFPPAGSFGPAALDARSEVDAVVLVAAGVGITPMVSMAYDATRPTAVIHAVKNGKQWPFRAEFRKISAAAPKTMKLRAFLSRPEEKDLAVANAAAHDWEIAARRVRAEDLLQVAKDLGATKPMFCFCGPLPFSAPLMAALEEAGIPAADIKSESFG